MRPDPVSRGVALFTAFTRFAPGALNPARNGVEAVVLEDGVLRAVKRSSRKRATVRAGRPILSTTVNGIGAPISLWEPYLCCAPYRRRIRQC